MAGPVVVSAPIVGLCNGPVTEPEAGLGSALLDVPGDDLWTALVVSCVDPCVFLYVPLA